METHTFLCFDCDHWKCMYVDSSIKITHVLPIATMIESRMVDIFWFVVQSYVKLWFVRLPFKHQPIHTPIKYSCPIKISSWIKHAYLGSTWTWCVCVCLISTTWSKWDYFVLLSRINKNIESGVWMGMLIRTTPNGALKRLYYDHKFCWIVMNFIQLGRGVYDHIIRRIILNLTMNNIP